MRILYLRSIYRVVMATVVYCGLSTSCSADPLISFTVTDLGPGTPTFATGANGGVVIAGNGLTAYSFQTAQDTSLAPQRLLASGFPLYRQAETWSPLTYGNPANAYSTLTGTMSNANGVVVGVNDHGVLGHSNGSTDAYYVKQGPDGSWGPPTYMWSGNSNGSGFLAPNATITGINALNEVLGSGLGDGYPAAYQPQTYLYITDLNKVPYINNPGAPQTGGWDTLPNKLLDLNTLGVIQAGGWGNIMPVAIDDEGRILVTGNQASSIPGSLSRGAVHTLLLTPVGVSSDPLAVPAPEPGALSLAVLTIAALALRRAARGLRYD